MSPAKKKKPANAAKHNSKPQPSDPSELEPITSTSVQRKRKNPDSSLTLTSDQMAAFQDYLKQQGKKQAPVSEKEKKDEENKSKFFSVVHYNLTICLQKFRKETAF